MKVIQVEELAALGDDAQVVDVREPDELERISLDRPHLRIPMSSFLDHVDELPEAGTIYVLCHSGARSARVAEYLEQQGRDAVNVEGGIMAWHWAGLPTIQG
ncbi:rhodanese-like domain-containing protein [Homoserinibacter sp. YIM 151385]|uniref:rhodanese-like domain-containing protein n=1 Tax=Homoserinibacter sp. YIM 151385 TaxID=2985506 RepID=UPI0022F08B0B|nr:rhodanese-like domain-containing protein [Homoserinibacter sp. YIM 151385]WBU39154.1 rhodanese-like domain-containing protein [Homoserinibacter sp. YIM 151385]